MRVEGGSDWPVVESTGSKVRNIPATDLPSSSKRLKFEHAFLVSRTSNWMPVELRDRFKLEIASWFKLEIDRPTPKMSNSGRG